MIKYNITIHTPQMNCKLCFEDLTDNNTVLYRMGATDNFVEFDYCVVCLDNVLDNQWDWYITDLKTVDCEKKLRDLIYEGPPIRFRDHMIADNKEIHEFYFDGGVKSSRSRCNLDIAAVRELKNELLSIIPVLNDIDYITMIKQILGKFNL